MISKAQNPDDREPLAGDLDAVRLDQARLLLKRTRTSCLIVESVVLYFTALIAFSQEYVFAAVWFAVTTALVAVVYVYPRIVVPGGLTPENFRRYLTGHQVISGITGLTWSAFAIAFIDADSVLHLFIAINIVCSISLGGMLPSAEYRPTFVALATGMFVPFSAYWLIAVDGPLRLIGLGTLILYGFGLLVSARAEVQTLTTLAAERNRRLGEKLREQNRLIEKASADKSHFLAAVSHDMSQPLQAQGFFLRALRATLDRPDQLSLLDRVEAAWRSQQSLLQSLVETARLDSGAIIVKRKPFALGPVLSTLRTEFAETARGKSITLVFSEDGASVHSDPLLVTRILRNLLSNALKFTPEGGHVELSCKAEADTVVIVVSDSGPGIAADQQDMVFEEYVQLQQAGHDGPRGLGLGLNIVRQLTRKLDIALEMESRPGDGTRISITLPRSRAADTADTDVSELHEFGGAPLVVLVEDEIAVRESLSVLLTMWGCSVIAAPSGIEAVRLMSWSDQTPALLIADKRLAGGEDGIETIGALRGELAHDVPAILLTGDIHSFEQAGDMPHLTVLPKPAEAEMLHGVLVDALRASAKN